jgi:hypothetical protein
MLDLTEKAESLRAQAAELAATEAELKEHADALEKRRERLRAEQRRTNARERELFAHKMELMAAETNLEPLELLERRERQLLEDEENVRDLTLELDRRAAKLDAREARLIANLEVARERIGRRERELAAVEERLHRREEEMAAYVALAQNELTRR